MDANHVGAGVPRRAGGALGTVPQAARYAGLAGLLGAFVYGLVFSLGTPAVSLLLVLTVAAAEHRPAYGSLLALGYGIGRGLPFLLLGLFSGAAMRLRCQPSWSRAIRVTTGSLLLVITGYYLWIFLRFS